MGFFSSICSFVGSAVRAVGSAVSSVAKAVGRGIGGIVGGVASWVKENIFDIAEAGSYDTSTATVDETKKINELLENCIRSYGGKAEEYDELAAVILEDQFNALEKTLEEINELGSGKIIDDYIFESFRQNLGYIKKDLNKIYSKQISNVFSLNNSKLLDILKLDKGSEKKEKIRRLAVDTIAEANRKLLEEISYFVRKQQKFIAGRLIEYMQSVKAKLEATQAETKKILDAKNEDKDSLDALKNKYNQLISQFELLGNVLNRKG